MKFSLGQNLIIVPRWKGRAFGVTRAAYGFTRERERDWGFVIDGFEGNDDGVSQRIRGR